MATQSTVSQNRASKESFHEDAFARPSINKQNADEMHAFQALKNRLANVGAPETAYNESHQSYPMDNSNPLPSSDMSMPACASAPEQDAHQADPKLNKAVIFRNMLLDRIASENLYDVVKKNPAVYFNKAPFIDPNEGFRRADLLKKMQSCQFDLEHLNRNDLARAHKFDMLDLEKFLLEDNISTKEESANSEHTKGNVQPQEESEIPWELVAMQNEFRALIRGDPTLDSAESILKGKHITDPRQFTQEDLERIREWDKGRRDRELLDCALEPQQNIFEINEEVKESVKILQDTKLNVLEDEAYQGSIAEVQHESESRWDNFMCKKSARPWKSGASDKIPFYGDRLSKVPKIGSFNIGPICEQPKKMDKADSRKKHFTHYRVLKGRDVKNSGRSVLTKNYPD